MKIILMLFLAVNLYARDQISNRFPSAVAIFHLNEGTGLTTRNEADLLANTIVGAAWVDGKIGRALDFVGSNIRVKIPMPAYLHNQVSVGAWVFVRGITGNHTGVLSSVTTDWGWGPAFSFEVSVYGVTVAGRYGFAMRLNPILGHAMSTSLLEFNRWHHIFFTYDGAFARWYIDGVLDRTVPLTGNISVPARTWNIGTMSTAAPNSNAIFDEVVFFNRGLSCGEVQYIHSLGRRKRISAN